MIVKVAYILGMCISITEDDAICILMHSQWYDAFPMILMHSQWYDALKIHMKRYDWPLLWCSAIRFRFDSTQCDSMVKWCYAMQYDTDSLLLFHWFRQTAMLIYILCDSQDSPVVLWYVIFMYSNGDERTHLINIKKIYIYIYIYTVPSTNIGTLDKCEKRRLWK